MRRVFHLPAACTVFLLLAAACATTETTTSRQKSAHPRTSVSVLARELSLRPGYDKTRNRVVLEGTSGQVVLYPGTCVALVNGYRLKGMSRVDRRGSDFTLLKSDARRIRSALGAHPPPRDVRAAETRTPSSALRPARAVHTDEPDPAWDVKIRRAWLYTVIHHSATESGSAASFHRSHRRDRGWDGLGYHFVIGNGEGSADGLIETGYRWSRQITGAHAGRPRADVNLMNERGIGICLVGDFNRKPPTKRQIEALHRLITWLRGRLDIPADRVLVHRDIRGTECPGRYFPAREFLTPRRDVPASYR